MQPTLEQLDIIPVRLRVASILRKAILAGEYTEGQEISLTETARLLGVSRTPVREALQMLSSEGLIELRMNKGAIVRGINSKFIIDHYEMRILLESEAVARAIAREMDTAELLTLQAAIEADLDRLTEDRYVGYNQVFHTTIWTAADNEKLYTMLVNLWNGPSIGKTSRSADHWCRSIEDHRNILTCIQNHDVPGGRAAMESHLNRSMDNILDSYQALSKG